MGYFHGITCIVPDPLAQRTALPCCILEVISSELATQDIQVVHDNFGLNFSLMFKVHKIWSVDTQENSWNCCHQMSDFKAKMHHIRFRLLGELTALPRPPAGFKGAYLRVGDGRGREGREEGGREGKRCRGRFIQVLRGDRRPHLQTPNSQKHFSVQINVQLKSMPGLNLIFTRQTCMAATVTFYVGLEAPTFC